jgi:hypothetical protein
MRTYVCRKLWLYEHLTRKGFEPFKVSVDKYDTKKTIWLYTDSPELREEVENYYSVRIAN